MSVAAPAARAPPAHELYRAHARLTGAAVVCEVARTGRAYTGVLSAIDPETGNVLLVVPGAVTGGDATAAADGDGDALKSVLLPPTGGVTIRELPYTEAPAVHAAVRRR